eukprot:1156916-Pelagomonas_calceolata.AAC.1
MLLVSIQLVRLSHGVSGEKEKKKKKKKRLPHDKARIPACWKHAKFSPLYKKVPLLIPNSYRMLAVSGTMLGCVPMLYVLYSLTGATRQTKYRIPSLHAACTVRPNSSSRLHAAFLGFKQAYDTIPREALWQHLRCISMPTSLLSVIQVQMMNVDSSAEGERGAVTGTEDVCVTHMLYADDLTLLSNEAGALQTMLCRLDVYARKTHLIINAVKHLKSEVHFNSSGNNLPVLTIGSDTLAYKDSFKYLGMMFYSTLNMAKLAENASRAMLTSAYRIRRSLGVKQTTTDWAVLRGCGHQPLQYDWFRAAVKLYNSML